MSDLVNPASWSIYRRLMRIVPRTLLFLSLSAATALGCGWFMSTSHSVRFNDYQNEREMARLPPLPNLANNTNSLRVYWNVEDSDPDPTYDQAQDRAADVNVLWVRAEEAEDEGKLSLERNLLREYLDETKINRDVWFDPTDCQLRRNAAFDLLDALAALDRGSSASRVKQYVTARRLHDKGDYGEDLDRALSEAASDVNLKDNVAYLKAAGIYQQKQFEEAAQAFDAIAHRYPNSEKREASIFMSALAFMKASVAYTPTSGDEEHLHENEQSQPHDIAIDGPFKKALAGFRRVLTDYPRGRYANDACGWTAYLLLRKKDRAGALVEYYRLLADKTDENARVEAAFSLELVRHHATDEEIDRVEKELANEPDVALVYAYHNLFNFAIDPSSPVPIYKVVRDSSGNVDYQATESLNDSYEEEKDRANRSIEQKTRLRTLSFSQKLMNNYPNLSLGASFALRAAQAAQELENNEAAAQFARRALQGRIKSDEREQALWTLGVAEHGRRQLDAARKTFSALLRDYPKSSLTEGTRRTLAIISEDEGDLEGALEQYVELDYRLDIAYFIDVFMTPEQLAGFIERHPNSPKKNELLYALGVRHLRANRWNDARTAFLNVKAPPDANYGYSGPSEDCERSGSDAKHCSDVKETFDNETRLITHRLLMRDIQTANDLETLERKVSHASDNEAAAEALYQVASYQYEATSLLFYNPVAWNGYRYHTLGDFALWGKYRTTTESQTLFKYMEEHDTVARALKIYLEVVNLYPHTRAARDAFYSAAVCHERLSNYSPYWRLLYESGMHAGSRMVTYADVKAAYPGYQLPRGTYGWQPSTRTVYGGPGWAAPPKPIPPPTRWERLRMFVENLYDGIRFLWSAKLQRWTTLIALLFGVWFTTRIAKRNRKLLKPKITRVRIAMPQATLDQPFTALFWKAPKEIAYRDQLKQFLCIRGIEFWQLARDQRSRPILLRNILSHSLLAWLIATLFWILHFG